MPHRRTDRRWSWYAQVRDAVVALVGVGILGLMAFRNSYPIGGIVTALVCVGALSASAALKALVGRWEANRYDDRDETNGRRVPPPGEAEPAKEPGTP